jgi:hypothetical protein
MGRGMLAVGREPAMLARQVSLEDPRGLPALVKQAFRLAPSRLIVGEMRLEDCLDLVEALNAWAPRLVGENFCTIVCDVEPAALPCDPQSRKGRITRCMTTGWIQKGGSIPSGRLGLSSGGCRVHGWFERGDLLSARLGPLEAHAGY